MEQWPEVSEIVELLLSGVKEALAGNIVGVYLRGSLATGDFDPVVSDVDFLVVTERPVTPDEFALLAALHERLGRLPNRYGNDLEGAYLPRQAARRYKPGEHHPTIYRGDHFRWSEHGVNWLLERRVVREQGVTLLGPDPESIIDPISTEEVQEAVRARMRDWAEWARDVTNPEWQGALGHKAYVVETMCRALYTLQRGELCSKPKAVAWALETFPEPWRTTVRRSEKWRNFQTADPSVIPEVRGLVLWACAVAEGARSLEQENENRAGTS